MSYTPKMKELIRVVEASRQRRYAERHARLSPEEKQQLLEAFHPDYRPDTMRPIRSVSQRVSHAYELVDVWNPGVD